jgi:hypothetical protein
MRQTCLKDWGQPQSHYLNSDDADLDLGDELGDFGQPVEDENGIITILSDLIVKLSLLVLLLLCVAAMGLCIYKLGGNFKPILQRAICDTAAIAVPPAKP